MVLTVIVPIYNDSDLIIPFCESFSELKEKLSHVDLRVIFVDDGSKQNPFEDKLVDQLIDSYRFVSIMRLDKNFGQHTAILVGIEKALFASDIVGFMNVDCEDPPSEIVRLLAGFDGDGCNCVTSLRTNREKDLLRDLTSHFFHAMINYLTESGVPENCSTLRLYNKDGASKLLRYWSYQPYIPGIEQLAGLNIKYIQTLQTPRISGKSSYTFVKRLKFAIRIVLGFSDFPLKIVIFLGVIFTVLGFVLGVNIFLQRIFGLIYTPGYSSIICLLIFFGGMQMLTLGVIGLYVGRIFEHSKKFPLYLLKDSRISYEN